MRAALLGLVLLVAPGLVAAVLLHPDPAAWPRSPRAGTVHVDPPARWDGPALESLALLRRVTSKETRAARPTLAACERRALHARNHTRVYRRCATQALSRLGAFAMANAQMLQNLAGSAGPTEACRRRVLTLSALTGSLGGGVRNTLRSYGAPWGELLAASRAIRETARETFEVARAKGWRSTCRPLPRATVEVPTA